jgi:hypothetical protein
MATRGCLLVAAVIAAAAAACGGGNRGAPACALALPVAPGVILQRLTDVPSAALTEVPRGLPAQLPARVVGHRQGSVLVAYEGNKLVLGYQGREFPTDTTYAFGLLTVDDSSQRVVGVLIYPSSTVPRGRPLLGVVSGGGATLGLYGIRVDWSDVSNPRCPLLGDTAAARTP